MFCTIWLPDADGKHLYCAAAPSLPGFAPSVGRYVCWSERRILRHGRLSEGAGLCGRHSHAIPSGTTIVDLMSPYGIRAVWSRPLFTREGKVLGTFAILYREVA